MALVHSNHTRWFERPPRAIYIFRSRSSVAVANVARLAVRALFAILVVLLLYSVATSVARADESTGTADHREHHSLADIRNAAERFVRNRSESLTVNTATLITTAAELDSRLNLDRCEGELNAFALNGAAMTARVTIGVRCTQGASWTVYVPVSVESEMDVAILRNSMARETHLAASDIDIQRRRVPGFGSAYISNVSSLRDQHLKRALPAGTLLQADMLARDVVVKRGQQVLLVFAANGLAIQAPGLAMADGGTSDRIRVQNQTSLKVVEGVIESGNLVRVGL